MEWVSGEICGRVAQLSSQLPHTRKVVGSNPPPADLWGMIDYTIMTLVGVVVDSLDHSQCIIVSMYVTWNVNAAADTKTPRPMCQQHCTQRQ